MKKVSVNVQTGIYMGPTGQLIELEIGMIDEGFAIRVTALNREQILLSKVVSVDDHDALEILAHLIYTSEFLGEL